jgi:hypothetical protein
MGEEQPPGGAETPEGQPPGGPAGQPPGSNPQGPKPFWRRTPFLMAAPPLTFIAIVTIVGCVSTSSPTASPPSARSYPDVQSLLAAMAQHGAACSNVSIKTGSTVGGALNTFAECSGTSSGDTAIVIFTDHASAVDYANSMLNLSAEQSLGPAAEVVGPDWTVNTSPAFAAKVVKAVGGQLITEPSSAPSASSAPQPSGSASGSPSLSASPSPTMTKQTDIVVFKVSGSGYPSILYGTDSNNISPPGGYGPLGDGNALPWSASLSYDPNALYYAVTAQLEGYGDISDSVTEVITTYCSDGHHKTESFPLASGHASGGYNIARAEYAGGDTGNATQAETDAGC